MIISKITGQPVKVEFAMVGKGKILHYTMGNDETLCSRAVSAYLGSDRDGQVCKTCDRVYREQSAAYDEWSAAQVKDANREDMDDMIVPDDAFITASLIMDSDPSTWAPEFERPEAKECFYGCGTDVVAVFNDMYGVTQGVCAKDRSLVDGQTYDIPAPLVSTVCVIQNTPGMVGRNHYHAPGCHDIQREMGRYGQTREDITEFEFPDVASILAYEYGDIASDSAESGTAEWWAEVMSNASYTPDESCGVKIMPCLSIPMGRVGDSPLVFSGGLYRAGFDAPSPERVEAAKAEILAHEWSTCSDVDCITCVAKADMLPAPISSEDPGDAGFVEHMTTREYLLSVIVDESTGATVNLGWVELTLNDAHHGDVVKVAEEYGRVHGMGTPRNGWASIIVMHDMD